MQSFEHSLALPFLGIGMKTDIFQSCGHCWVFQICQHIECNIIFQNLKQLNWSSITSSSFVCSDASEGPLDFGLQDIWLQVSDHSITVIWFMVIIFVQFFPIILPPLLNGICFCQVHTISVLYCAHLCMKYFLGISDFLEEISSLSCSIVFLYFFALLITEEGFLISPCYSLEICIQMGISFIFSIAVHFSAFLSYL